jgi:hypothetical protein
MCFDESILGVMNIKSTQKPPEIRKYLQSGVVRIPIYETPGCDNAQYAVVQCGKVICSRVIPNEFSGLKSCECQNDSILDGGGGAHKRGCEKYGELTPEALRKVRENNDKTGGGRPVYTGLVIRRNGYRRRLDPLAGSGE